MKKPIGKYISIKTDAFQEAFDMIIDQMTMPWRLDEMVSAMERQLDVPMDEKLPLRPYLRTWLNDAVSRRSDVRVVKRGATVIIRKPSHEKED